MIPYTSKSRPFLSWTLAVASGLLPSAWSAELPAQEAESAPAADAQRTAADGEAAGFVVTRQDRPFRKGVLVLNKDLDETKPLGVIDPAGFVVNSGLLIGAVNERWVTGFSLATKQHTWFFETETGLTAPSGSFGSSVVLGFRDGKVVKVEALTGKKVWTASLDSFAERGFVLHGTTLYVVTAAQVLYALDFQTGKTLWLYDGGFPETLTIRGGAKPVVSDGNVYFGIASGEVLAVEADTGKPVWRYNPAYNDARFHDVIGELVVRAGKLLVTRYDGLLAAIDIAAGVRSLAWQEQLPGLTTSTYRGNRYFVGGLNGDVYGINPEDGRRLWRVATGVPVTSITAGETTLFVAGANGRISAIDASDGSLLWYDELGSSIASPPVVLEDSIYFSTGLKTVYSYKIR